MRERAIFLDSCYALAPAERSGYHLTGYIGFFYALFAEGDDFRQVREDDEVAWRQ